MINIIVYEDDKNFMQKNIMSINKALSQYDVDYRIKKYSSYTKELEEVIKNKETKKIYILDVEMPKVSGLELASKIRENDWDSIIIFATAYEKYQNDVFYIRLMALDFISKYDGYEERLMDGIKDALSIIDKSRVFKFSYNHVIYRIPYDQICYIEKEPIIKRCIIHTYNDDFAIAGTLNGIMKKLEGNFIRTHQSCIVNIDNATEIDLATNTIFFNEEICTDMLTDKMKKEVKEAAGII